MVYDRRQKKSIRIIPEDADISTPACIVSLMRFSKPPQEWGTSEQRQYGHSREFCQDMGWPAPDLDIDLRGTSAYPKGGRRAVHRSDKTPYGQFLEAVQTPNSPYPRNTALLVEAFHRFSREEVMVAATDLFNLLHAGVMVCLTHPSKRRIYKGNIPYRDLVELTEEMNLSNQESHTKSDLICDAKALQRAKTFEEGVPLAVRCPGWIKHIGYSKQDMSLGHYELIEHRVLIVQRIFAMGKDIGAVLIAQILNDERVEYWGYTGKWTSMYISHLLKDPTVLGFYVHKEPQRVEVPDPDGGTKIITRWIEVGRKKIYPGIITTDLFGEVQAAIGERREKHNITGAVGGPRAQRKFATPYANLFRGISYCECGASLQRLYRPIARGLFHQQAVTPDGLFETAEAAARHYGVSGDVIRRRIEHNEPGYAFQAREPGFTHSTPYLVCRNIIDHRCTNNNTYDCDLLERQIFEIVVPQLLAAPATAPSTNRRDRIEALETEIAAKKKAAEDTMEFYGATAVGAAKVRQLEAEIHALDGELETEQRLYHVRFQPDTLKLLQETYEKSQQPGAKLIELRAQLARRLRSIIERITLQRDGEINVTFSSAMVQYTSGLEGGAMLRMLQPLRDGHRGRPRLAEKPIIAHDVLKRDIIEIFRREGCDAMPSQELADHVSRLERPWRIVNVYQLANALKTLGIAPVSMHFDHDRMRGYRLGQFTGEFTRLPELVSLPRTPENAVILNELVRDIHAIFAVRKAKQLSFPEILVQLHGMGERWERIRTTQRLARILGYAGLQSVALAVPSGTVAGVGRPSKRGLKLEQLREVLMKNGRSNILPKRSYNGRENIM